MTSSPAPDLEPRTETGRRLLASSWSLGPGEPLMADTILAIETEAARAAQAESGRLREALLQATDGLPRFLDRLNRDHRRHFTETGSHFDLDTIKLYSAAIKDVRAALLATPPAPSDHGAPTRTEIIFAVLHVWQWIENHTTVAKPLVNGRKVNEFLDDILRYDRQHALLATPPAPSDHGALDVERLARAIQRRIGWESTAIALGDDTYPGDPDEWDREAAAAIAAEYARLAAPSVPPEPASPEAM